MKRRSRINKPFRFNIPSPHELLVRLFRRVTLLQASRRTWIMILNQNIKGFVCRTFFKSSLRILRTIFSKPNVNALVVAIRALSREALKMMSGYFGLMARRFSDSRNEQSHGFCPELTMAFHSGLLTF